MDEEKRMASFHLVEADGVRSAGKALSRLTSYLPGGRPLRAGTERWPAATERAYRLIADNRSRIGPLIPDALKQRATAAIDSRT
jgi:predicted DCC family thiol-disulfide oxidoreductase YuxK